MLIAGLSDICAYVKPERIIIITPVIDALQACIDLYDEPDHLLALNRYEKWVAA